MAHNCLDVPIRIYYKYVRFYKNAFGTKSIIIQPTRIKCQKVQCFIMCFGLYIYTNKLGLFANNLRNDCTRVTAYSFGISTRVG